MPKLTKSKRTQELKAVAEILTCMAPVQSAKKFHH